jgi:hypothetical protein
LADAGNGAGLGDGIRQWFVHFHLAIRKPRYPGDCARVFAGDGEK